MITMQTRDILEECVKAWIDSYSNLRKPEWSSAIETEISEDLARMQMQPAIMDDHRRFVVIKAPKEDHISSIRDGVSSCDLEWNGDAESISTSSNG